MTNSAQCWAINVKANLHLLRAALPTFNANPDGGSMLITSSVAVSPAPLLSSLWDTYRLIWGKASNPVGSAMAYCVSKAAG